MVKLSSLKCQFKCVAETYKYKILLFRSDSIKTQITFDCECVHGLSDCILYGIDNRNHHICMAFLQYESCYVHSNDNSV